VRGEKRLVFLLAMPVRRDWDIATETRVVEWREATLDGPAA